MKWFLVLLASIILSEEKNDWVESNQDLINSKLYQIHFNQKNKIVIAGDTHSNILNSSVMYLDSNIKYETNDRIVIINPDSLTILNKVTNQIFIDDLKQEYEFLSSINIIGILEGSHLDMSGDYYYYNNGFPIKIYFSNNDISEIEINYHDIDINLFNIRISDIDSVIISNYFKIGNSSSSIFDLRIK
tara:strand:- start:458 stop:1021 length:564 start_codon:yes stop_codon:yes gene_type:complete